MAKTLEFLFDIGAPNGYLAWTVLPEIVARTGARLVTIPVAIGGIFKATGNRAPIFAYADVPAKLAYEQLEMRRFVAAHNLPFAMNPHFPVNTLLAMRVAVAAQAAGQLDAFLNVAYPAMWEHGRNLADPDVIAEVLSAAGLDGAALVAQASDQAIKDALLANTEAAVARGAFGIPTFFVDGEMWWGKERLPQVEVALA